MVSRDSDCNGRVFDLRSGGGGFNGRSRGYHVVTTWTGECLQTGKPFTCITNNTRPTQSSIPSG